MDLPFEIGDSPTLKIRGLIATRKIEKGTLVEACPVLLVSKSEERPLFQTVLQKYYFEWTKNHHVIVFGYGSLMNHSYAPNIKYFHDYKHALLNFRAIKTIEKGEELLTNYNWDPDDKTPVDAFLIDFNNHQH